MEQIGKYRIDAVLGQGAMGVVYRGYDTVLERNVAIKTIHPHLLTGPVGEQLLQRFKTEATAAARCQHGNIVSVYDFGQHEGMPYIAMEFVRGRGLDEILQEQRGLPLKRINTIVLGVCHGLHYAHRKGVVHRDVKPANIMVLEGDRIKLADFGIAKISTAEMTQAGFAIGTPSYMAPEQRDGGRVDERADLFAFGVVLFELLAWCSDIPAALRQTAVKAILELPASKKLDYTQRFPPSMAAFLNRCLAVDPEQRPASVTELAEGYKLALQNIRQPAHVVEAAATQPQGSAATEAEQAWMRQALRALEEQLAHYIGPIARNVVRDGYQHTRNIAQLVELLAAEIPDEAERKRFIKECNTDTGITSLGKQAPAAPDPASAASALAQSAPVQNTPEAGDDAATQIAGQAMPSGPAPVQALDATISSAVRTAVEKALAFHIGPMAAIVLQSHLVTEATREGLLEALGEEIPDDKERRDFIKRARILLGRAPDV
jgi:serine/threonine-protein kinase